MKVFISFFLEFLFLFLRYFSGMVTTEPTNSQSLIHLLAQEGDTVAPPISTKQCWPLPGLQEKGESRVG